MVKTVIKEIIIFLLLLVSLALLLGILLYDYIPTTREIPARAISYSLPKEIQEELDKILSSERAETIEKTFSVDSTDLINYERTNQYDRGKVNPFERHVPPVAQEPGPNPNPNPGPNPVPGGTNNETTPENNTTNGGSGNNVGNFYNNSTTK
jgi:hypothetical protein